MQKVYIAAKKKQNRETKFVVSLVVPTYKPGGYIEECLASLGAQTLNASKFEVIIVLNGCDEPWRSQIRAFIDRHLSKHCVRLIQTNVAGVSNARNIGIEEAQGEFIGFLDDDDYVSPSYLEELSGISTETCVGLSDSAYFEDGGDVLNFDNRQHCIFARYSSGVPAPSIFNVRSYFNGPVMKILHRDIIGCRRFDIRFKNSEDSLFMTLVSDKIESVRFTSSSAVYYRRIRRGSATTLHRTLRQKLLNQMRVSGQVCGYWIKNPVAYNLPFILSRFAAGIKSLIVD